ncbi:MAG TPA: peptidylprolyl isomerase [Spirochaetota bacterium]|nr:peptidylprolyl isomerase [Spirochaetota bacterium]HOL57189.1 peptidylprolyl isomerase [Spirochaetota bacterium]HPP04784.1 peptidylprolyl isomerase [Spirochaetota bacterium]
MEGIKIGDIVSVAYKAKLNNGEIFDSTDSQNPLIFKVGDNRLLQKFEEAVIGMKKGETKTIYLKCEDAYGQYDEFLVFDVDKSMFPENMTIELGEPIQLRMTDGTYGIAIIKEIKDQTVILDANHPLAGKDINFDITIVGINNVSEEEFNSMFNHSCSCEDEECNCEEGCGN